MVLDGFVIDEPETPANVRAFNHPGSGRVPRPASWPWGDATRANAGWWECAWIHGVIPT